MNERIKKLRKALGLTQQEFADKMGVSRNNVATYEAGKSNPGESAITLICRTFNVREAWLRTGEGEMFLTMTRDEEIATFVGSALSTEDDTFKKRLIAALARLEEADWEVLEKLVLDFAKKGD